MGAEHSAATKRADRIGERLERAASGFLVRQRWFGGKSREIDSVRMADWVDLPGGAEPYGLAILDVRYRSGSPDRYAALLGLVREPGQDPVVDSAEAGTASHLVEASGREDAARALLRGLLRAQDLPSSAGLRLRFEDIHPSDEGAIREEAVEREPIRAMGAEQSNTTLRMGSRYVFKLIRRVQPGLNPEVEIGRFLRKTSFEMAPFLRGSIAYVPSGEEPSILGVASDWIPNEGDGWTYVLGRMRAEKDETSMLGEIDRLGEATGALHRILASGEDSAFRPEPATRADADAWSASLHERARRLRDLLPGRSFDALRAAASPPSVEGGAGFRKIRVHGDFHLGQTLKTAAGWVLFDFEGEPARSMEERRAKQPALKDVAGMLRSIDYAVEVARDESDSRPRDAAPLRAAFLDGYRRTVAGGPVPILPAGERALRAWLDFFVLDKALYELEYERDNRPAWTRIPLAGIREILERGTA